MARKSRSKQRSKGAGTRSSKAKSSGKSSNSRGSGTGGGASGSKGGGSKGGGSKSGGSKSGGSKSKSTSTKSKSTKSTSTKKTYSRPATTVAQKRFREREAAGLSGLTGGEKGTKTNLNKNRPGMPDTSTIGKYRASQREQVQNAALGRQATFQTGIPSGDNLKAGSFGISEAGKIQAEKNRAEAAAKAAADKAEATRVRRFDPNRLFGNYSPQIGGKLATTFADTFAKPKFMYQGNMAGRLPGLSNYFTPDVGTGIPYTKGGNLRGIPFTGGDKTGSLTKFKVPDGAKLSRSPLGVRQFKLNPSQMKNLGIGLTDDASKFAAKGLSKYGARAIPFVGAVPSLIDAGVRLKNQDYTGAALSVGSAIPGKIGWASLGVQAAYDASKALNTGDTTKVASTEAGGLNIGGGVDSEAKSNDLGRSLSIGDKVKTGLGFAKDFATQALFGGPTADGTLTGNTDFAGNLPGAQGYDNRDVKIKSAFNNAMNSEGVQQLGEGLGLPKNFKSQLKDTAEAGNQYFSGMTTDRDSIYSSVSDTLRDLSSNPKLGTTARYINQMTTDNPNVSDSERDKKVSFFGMKTPLSNENVADIRSAFNEKNDKFQGLSMADRGMIEGGGGNRIVSGKLTDSIRGVLSGYKGDPNIGLGKGEGVTLGSMIDAAPTLASNIGTEGTLANKRINEIKRLAPGGDITTPSLIRGQLPLGGRRYGGINMTGGGNQSMFIPPAPPAVPQQQELPLPLITQQTGVGAGNLQNIQQNAYNNQMSMYGTNPNYFAQFRPQQRFPRRGRFRSAFSRDYFN